MATTKKAAKKVAPKKKVRDTSNEAPTAKEMATAMKRAKEVASGKKNGVIIVLEEFTNKKGQKGIEGMTYWKGMDPKARVQTLLNVSGMPPQIFMLKATLTSGAMEMDDHEHDKDGNCITPKKRK